MKKKIIYTLLILISLLILNSSVYYIINRINVMLESNRFTAFYNIANDIDSKYAAIVDNVEFFFNDFFNQIKYFFIWLWKVLISPDALIIYTLIFQNLVFMYAFFKMWVYGKCLEFKTSKLANALNVVIIWFLDLINYIKQLYKKENKRIKIIIIWLSGIGIIIAFEFVIFMIHYFIGAFTFTSHEVLFALFRYLIVNLVNWFMFEKPIIIISVLLLLFILLAIYMGKNKLRKNWISFKLNFVGNSEYANIISGAPGTGKTSTAVNCQYAQSELYIDNYVDLLLDFEIMHPNINFSKIRLMMKVYFLDFTEEEINKIFELDKLILFDLLKLQDYITDDLVKAFFNEYYRGSCILSGSPLLDPYSKRTCTSGMARALDYNSLRLFKKDINLGLEEDTVALFDEFDKEWNSHTSQKEVNEDGVHVFFSYVRQLGTKAWMTCQGLGQGLKNIKVCCGKFYWLYDKKIKMPLLISIVYAPVLFIDSKISSVIKEYLGDRIKTGKWTFRQSQFIYKRNNVSFLYQLMKWIACLSHKLVNYFQKYYYYKIYAEESYDPDGKMVKKVTYNINFCDFYDNDVPTYNTTQFRAFYDDFRTLIEKKKRVIQNIQLFDAWTSLEPSMDEYVKTNQSVIKKIYDIQCGENNDR